MVQASRSVDTTSLALASCAFSARSCTSKAYKVSPLVSMHCLPSQTSQVEAGAPQKADADCQNQHKLDYTRACCVLYRPKQV